MWIWLMMANWLPPLSARFWPKTEGFSVNIFHLNFFTISKKSFKSKVFNRKSNLDEKLLGTFQKSSNFPEIWETNRIRQVFFQVGKMSQKMRRFLNEAAKTEARSRSTFFIIFALYSAFRKWLWALWLLAYGQLPLWQMKAYNRNLIWLINQKL